MGFAPLNENGHLDRFKFYGVNTTLGFGAALHRRPLKEAFNAVKMQDVPRTHHELLWRWSFAVLFRPLSEMISLVNECVVSGHLDQHHLTPGSWHKLKHRQQNAD